MKPILSRQVKRGEILREWEPSEHQMTMDGLEAFKRRQEERRRKAQGQAGQVTELKRRIP